MSNTMHGAINFIVFALHLPAIVFVLKGYCQTPDLLPTMLALATRAGFGLLDLNFTSFNAVLNLAVQMTTVRPLAFISLPLFPSSPPPPPPLCLSLSLPLSHAVFVTVSRPAAFHTALCWHAFLPPM